MSGRVLLSSESESFDLEVDSCDLEGETRGKEGEPWGLKRKSCHLLRNPREWRGTYCYLKGEFSDQKVILMSRIIRIQGTEEK